MKLKTTKSNVKENYYRILSIGYCDAQYLLKYKHAFGYSTRVEGWACDYYDIDGVCISTGYSPLADKNMKYDYKVVREYEEKAISATKDEIDVLLTEMIEKLTPKEKQLTEAQQVYQSGRA